MWKDIKNWETYYQVSNLGRVKSVYRTITKSTGERATFREHMLSPGIGKHGYFQVVLQKPGLRSNKRVNQLVAEAFIPNPCNLPQACHTDDNPLNNSVDNLFWGTQDDNMKDKVAKGRQYKKLSIEEIEEIRILTSKKRYGRKKLALQYDVHPDTITKIKMDNHWSNRSA